MKSKHTEKAVETKYKNSDEPSKICRDFARMISLQVIKLWIKMVSNTGSINLSSPTVHPRTSQTKINISKIKHRLNKKQMLIRRLATETNASKSRIR